MKELRAGMLCWEIDEGIQVTLVEKVPHNHRFNQNPVWRLQGDDWWMIDTPITFVNRLGRSLQPYTQEKYLIPLEGDEDQFRSELEQIKQTSQETQHV